MNAFKAKLKEAQKKVEGMALEKKKEPAASPTAGPSSTPAAVPPPDTVTTPLPASDAPQSTEATATASTTAPDTTPAAAPEAGKDETFSPKVAEPTKAAAEPLPEEGEPTHVDTRGNGTVIKTYADGRKTTIYPDGKTINEFADGSSTTTWPDGRTTHHTPTVAKEDALDKAFSFGAKKLGFNLSRDTTEKITDKGRGLFEKKTGKKVSAKISN